MSKISDELRNWFSIDHCGSGLLVSNSECDRLLALADRIDSEMVELPKDADGVPVHVGDTVYTADGSEAYVARIDFVPDVPGVELRFPCGTISEYVPRYIYHTRPDSFERIADELEAKTSSCGHQGYIVVSRDEVIQIADRIRKLAKRED